MNIIGSKFLVDFEIAKAILDIRSETSITFTIVKKMGKKRTQPKR